MSRVDLLVSIVHDLTVLLKNIMLGIRDPGMLKHVNDELDTIIERIKRETAA